MGDFNYPNICWANNSTSSSMSSPDSLFLEYVEEIFFVQTVDQPTRWRGSNDPHTLDLILTNEDDMINDLIYDSPLGKSDHCTLRFNYMCCPEMLKNKCKSRRLYHKADYDRINAHLENVDWQAELNSDDLDVNWNTFLLIIKSIEDQFIPLKTYSINSVKKHKYPIDEATREAIKLKHKLSNKVLLSNDPNVRKDYNRIRNKVKKLTAKARKKFERGLASNAKTNPKMIWSYINSKSKINIGVGDLHLDPSDKNSPTTKQDQAKANILSHQFESVFTIETDGSIPTIENRLVTTSMPDMTIDDKCIAELLNKINVNKSPGIECLHPKFIKEAAS